MSDDKYLKALADCVRAAFEDEILVADVVDVDLEGDYEGFCRKFKEVFNEDFYEEN